MPTHCLMHLAFVECLSSARLFAFTSGQSLWGRTEHTEVADIEHWFRSCSLQKPCWLSVFLSCYFSKVSGST
jgi:hypothetical protein